jgi:transcriptional regulator with XRE-family HTH domain
MTVTGHTETARKKLRDSLTQEKLARRLGVSREHLNRVLNGKRSSEQLVRRYQNLLRTLPAAHAR